MIQILFRNVRPLVIGNIGLILLQVVLVWQGIWLIYPDQASLSTPVLTSSTEIPELFLPDLRTLPLSDLDIISLRNGDRVIRLTNTIWNSGDGPLELKAVHNPATQTMIVEQRIYGRDELQLSQPVGEFIWHEEHNHWHFKEFSIYELWTLSPIGGLDRLVSTSGKVSYCVIDSDIVDRAVDGFIPFGRYRGCGKTLQGLSVGWGDKYEYFLEGQSVSLAGVKDGFYVLKSTVNPDSLLLEANYDNNSTLYYLHVHGHNIESIDLEKYFERRCQPSDWWTMQRIICGY